MPTFISSKLFRYALFTVAFVMMMHGFFLRGVQTLNSTTVDFFNMWGVIEYVRGATPPGADIYAPDTQFEMGRRLQSAALSADSFLQKTATKENLEIYGGRLDAIATPLMYAFISGISSDSYRSSHSGFIVICLAAFLGSMLLLGRTFEFNLTATFFLTFLFLELYNPLVSDLRVGNINCIQLFAVSAYIFLSSRSKMFPAGAVLALCVLLKPTTLMIVVVAAAGACFHKPFRDQYALCAGGACGAVIGFLAPLALFPSISVWGDFIRSLPSTLEISRYPLDNGNIGLTMLVNHLTGVTISKAMYALLLPLAVFGQYRSSKISSGKGSKAAGSGTAVHVVGYGAVIMLCSSSLVWLHYYTILIPVMVYAIRPGIWKNGGAASWLLRAAAVTAFLLLSTPVEQFTPDTAVYAMVVNTAVLCVAALLVSEAVLAAVEKPGWQG